VFENHYTVQELSAMWRYSKTTIRKLVREEQSGVLHVEGPGLKKGTARQSYDTMTVSESAARRIYARLQRKPDALPKPAKRELKLISFERRRKSA
jgi:hypothetical protein